VSPFLPGIHRARLRPSSRLAVAARGSGHYWAYGLTWELVWGSKGETDAPGGGDLTFPLLCLLSVFPDCLHGQHGTVPAQDGDESPRGDERFAVKVRTRNVVLQYPFACTVEKLTVLWEL
jgi:hypothetical protein